MPESNILTRHFNSPRALIELQNLLVSGLGFDFSVAVEGGNARVATITPRNPQRYALSDTPRLMKAWLSASAAGAVAANVGTSALVFGGEATKLLELDADGVCCLFKAGTGVFTVTIGETGVATHFLNIEFLGVIVSSAAIAFT